MIPHAWSTFPVGMSLANRRVMHAVLPLGRLPTEHWPRDLEEGLEAAWGWASAPIDEAARISLELVALAERRGLPLPGLRLLTQAALGSNDRLALAERWLADDPEVVAMLVRVRAVGRALDGVALRARELRRRALELALAAPARVREAARQIWAAGPRPERDEWLRALEALPAAIKAHADGLREQAGALPELAEAARRQIPDALRSRARAGRLVRTDRLAAV